ncbi:hypothetical protein [Castellaniella sp.]|uniref:hypothetical protein n=1 Tax=Castellaniella sp. TaxID=1955812 RepID=UPI002AFF0005|nr:hypothetical protein [Castellaniella sp.]
MSRLSRLYAPRIPQLIQARFHQPLAVYDAPIPSAMLDTIARWLAEAIRSTAMPAAGAAPGMTALAVHAWVVLPDQITLLATPGDAQSLPRLMQGLGRRIGSGLLRSRVLTGRYHNALLEPGRWVLPAMVWVESRAVVSGRVMQATQWPWSSAAEHAGDNAMFSGWLRDHPDFWAEGDTPFARQAAWRKRLVSGLSPIQAQQIEAALHGQWALGEKIFLAHLERQASRRISPAPRGRPAHTK